MAETPKSIADKKKAPAKKIRQSAAEKAAKQGEKRRVRNRTVLTRLKHTLKGVRALTTRKEAEAALPGVYAALDKARKQGIIKTNTASRQKSRLTLAAQKLP